MSGYWMKQTLIVSVLTVLITLPAAAQQRRSQGPAKPAGGIPGKLEVSQKLGPAFKNAIEAHKAVIRAQIAALQALKKLNLEVKGYQGGGGGGGRVTLSSDAKAAKGGRGGATQDPKSQKEKLSETNPFALQTRAQNEYLRVVSFVVSSTGSYAVDPGEGSNSAVMTEKSDGTSNFQIGHHTVQSKIESQVGKIDAAIGKLNTQLYTVPVVGFWVEGGQQ